MKKLLLILFFVPTIIYSQSLTDQQINEHLKTISEELNKDCPMVIDEYTVLLNTMSINGIFMYNYKMDLSVLRDYGVSRSLWLNLQEDQLINFYCSSADVKWFRDQNVNVVWRYSDLSGNYVGKISLDNDNCR